MLSSRHRLAPLPVFAGLIALLVGASIAGLCFGTVDIGIADFATLLGAGPPTDEGPSAAVLRDLRLPRVLLAILVGAALACSGAAMQGLFRNPLADPGLIGVASGAALAAVAAIVGARGLGLNGNWLSYATPFAAFSGGLIAAALAARLSSAEGYTRTATLLLAGLAINSIAGAGIGLLTQSAGDAALREATFWLFGSLAKSGWPELIFAAPLLMLVLMLLPREARALNALLLGEPEATHLGVDVELLKRRVMLLIVVAVAACVAMAGVIGFVGLVVPHMVRLLLGPDHRTLLPAAAIGGAALLVLADLTARLALSPAEVPVGVLTALLGGPFFMGLLIRLRGRIEAW